MNKVIVETSARHIHLTREQVEILFGKGYQLQSKKALSQPGQFACNEKVTVTGPKGSFAVSILGPERPSAQLELSLTDARTLGIKAPVRESGMIAGTPGCHIAGPCGEFDLAEGVIAAQRHLHIIPADAEACGITDKQMVGIKVTTNGRSLTFFDVVVRVSDKAATRVHIDTDEANAGAISGEVEGEIIK